MNKTKTTKTREVDFGWWTETDGRRARLTWSLPGGRLYLFHTSTPPEHLVAAISEDQAREFVESLDHEDRTVAQVRRVAGETWPF